MKLHPAVSVLIAVTAAIIAGAIAALFLLTLATPSEGPPVPALRGAPHAASHVWGAPQLPPTAPTGEIPEGVKPMSAASVRDGRIGVISHMGAGFPASYLALPIGPGHAVHICGTRGCLDLTSTDAGPNHASLVAGRIADVSVQLFRVLCGPESRGLCRGSWRTIAAGPTLPETDTEGETP